MAFLFLLGLLGLAIPHKLVGTKGAEVERNKRIKMLKICGITLIFGSIGQLLLTFL